MDSSTDFKSAKKRENRSDDELEEQTSAMSSDYSSTSTAPDFPEVVIEKSTSTREGSISPEILGTPSTVAKMLLSEDVKDTKILVDSSKHFKLAKKPDNRGDDELEEQTSAMSSDYSSTSTAPDFSEVVEKSTSTREGSISPEMLGTPSKVAKMLLSEDVKDTKILVDSSKHFKLAKKQDNRGDDELEEQTSAMSSGYSSTSTVPNFPEVVEKSTSTREGSISPEMLGTPSKVAKMLPSEDDKVVSYFKTESDSLNAEWKRKLFPIEITQVSISDDSALCSEPGVSGANITEAIGTVKTVSASLGISGKLDKDINRPEESDVSLTDSSSLCSLSSSETSEKSKHGKTTSYYASKGDEFRNPYNLLKLGTQLRERGIEIRDINCPEKIVLCLDVSPNPILSGSDSNGGLTMRGLLKAVNSFVELKSGLDKRHEFAVMCLLNRYMLFQNYISDMNHLRKTIDACGDGFDEQYDVLDLEDLFENVIDQALLPYPVPGMKISPPFIVRLILIYIRSSVVPNFGEKSSHLATLKQSPFFFFDVLYVHEGNDASQKVYDALCEFCDDRSYIFNVRREFRAVQNCMMQLLGHSLQRSKQNENELTCEVAEPI